jgi:hypothetical protein
MGRAIWTNDLVVLAHIQIDVRMIKRGQGSDALEFLGTNFNLAKAFSVVKMRRGIVCHRSDLIGMT